MGTMQRIAETSNRWVDDHLVVSSCVAALVFFAILSAFGGPVWRHVVWALLMAAAIGGAAAFRKRIR